MIAPSIRQCCFEVDEDVKDMFYEKFKDRINENDFIKKSKNKGKYYIDTALINKVILEEEGIQINNIIDCEICTKCHPDKLHSYRDELENSGRNASIIMIRNNYLGGLHETKKIKGW